MLTRTGETDFGQLGCQECIHAICSNAGCLTYAFRTVQHYICPVLCVLYKCTVNCLLYIFRYFMLECPNAKIRNLS